MKLSTLLLRASTPADRLVMGVSALGIVVSGVMTTGEPGRKAVVFRDNQPVMTLPLDQDFKKEIPGRLGPVTIQVEQGRVRLLEYHSPRMIGTRTGWIQGAGRTTACVPCGVLVRVEGPGPAPTQNEFDGVSE
ncbi:MAG: NusG domain II-containing protein [Magnetococcales bacterium]|nr:NusG domain II-containing protein [Magnetococcales bacterium]